MSTVTASEIVVHPFSLVTCTFQAPEVYAGLVASIIVVGTVVTKALIF